MTFDYDFLMRIASPRPTVFERLLRIEHLSRWFCGWSRIEPKVGGSFKFGGETCIIPPEGRAWETTIDQGEVLRRFTFRWPMHGVETRVSYDLDDGPGDTAVMRAQHRGLPIRDTPGGSVQDMWRMCLGNLKSIAEGRGDSVRPDHLAPAASELRLSALIEAPPPKVFSAFANPTDLAHWLSGGVARNEARVEPRAGGAFGNGSLGDPDRVEDWITNQRIVLGWSREAIGRTLRFDFEEKASGTAVYLVEQGFAGDATETIHRERGWWSDHLVCLKNFVESGSSGFLNTYEEQTKET